MLGLFWGVAQLVAYATLVYIILFYLCVVVVLVWGRYDYWNGNALTHLVFLPLSLTLYFMWQRNKRENDTWLPFFYGIWFPALVFRDFIRALIFLVGFAANIVGLLSEALIDRLHPRIGPDMFESVLWAMRQAGVQHIDPEKFDRLQQKAKMLESQVNSQVSILDKLARFEEAKEEIFKMALQQNWSLQTVKNMQDQASYEIFGKKGVPKIKSKKSKKEKQQHTQQHYGKSNGGGSGAHNRRLPVNPVDTQSVESIHSEVGNFEPIRRSPRRGQSEPENSNLLRLLKALDDEQAAYTRS